MAQEYYNQHSQEELKVHFPSAWFYRAKNSLLPLSLLLILFFSKKKKEEEIVLHCSVRLL